MASLAGVWYANTVDGPADTIDFLQFFDEAYNSVHPATNRPCLEPGNIFVMDNCPTHHNEGGGILGEFLQELNIELVYMPHCMSTYSQDLNPVEYGSGKLRTLMKNQFVHVANENLKESLYILQLNALLQGVWLDIIKSLGI